jgi:hypothetical protein
MPQYNTVTAVDLNIMDFLDVKLCRQAPAFQKKCAASTFMAEDAGSRFLPNVGTYLPNNMTSHPRKP